MIHLDQLRVASPCHESWDGMDGDDRHRSCDRCQKNVYNISEMTANEAASLIAQHEGKLCVRFYRREDGTVMTKDCPVGAARIRKRRTVSFAWAASIAVSMVVTPIRRSEAIRVVKSKVPARTAVPAHSSKTTDVSKGPDPFRVPNQSHVQKRPQRLVVPEEQIWKQDNPGVIMGIMAAPPVQPAPPK